MTLTKDEHMLSLLYGDGTREGLVRALEEMKAALEPDEEELLSMTETLLGKLKSMTDARFQELTGDM